MPTREAEKRREERMALDAFLEIYGSAHAEPGRGRPGREPDFFVAFSKEGLIGIEATNDVERERRHVEESREEVVALAREEYESRNAIPLQVSCHWAQVQVERDRSASAARIAETVEEIAPLEAQGMADIRGMALYDRGLPNVATIMVLRHPVLTRNSWSVSDADLVRIVTQEEVESTIAKKEAKHSAFLDNHRGWLLIYSLDYRLSGISEVGEDALRATYKTRFSNVFALNVWRRELIEFRIEREDA